MARTRYASDPGLIARMGATMFLLGLVFVGLIVGLFFILDLYSSRGNSGQTTSTSAWVVLAALIGIGTAFASYYWSDKIALRTSGARLVSPNDSQDAARLHAIVDRLCALANMPKPRVAIAPTSMPNAFATGRSSKVAVVCATQGLLDKLDDNEELEGVLAHEMSHVAHKDVAVMTIASFLGILSGLITRIAFEMGLWGGFSDRGDDDDDSPAAVLFMVMIVSGLTWLLSFLLIRGLSRYRELAADRSGALLTGNPSAMSNALGRITGDMAQIPTQDLRKQQAFNAFFFTPAIKGASVMSLFATHPTLQVRQEKLAKLAVEIGR